MWLAVLEQAFDASRPLFDCILDLGLLAPELAVARAALSSASVPADVTVLVQRVKSLLFLLQRECRPSPILLCTSIGVTVYCGLFSIN